MQMLLPDNIHPEQSIYYNGALVLQAFANSVMDCGSLRALKRTITMPVCVVS
jgi:hypothetical protein